MFRNQARRAPAWELVAPKLGEKTKSEHYLWFRAPMSDFGAAKDFARRVLVGELVGSGEEDPPAVQAGEISQGSGRSRVPGD